MKSKLLYGKIRVVDNTVGSLTQEQKALIIGTILGDGYLRIIPRRNNAFLEVNHSINQKDYVDWKYRILKSIVKSGPRLRKGNGHRIACRFYTRSMSEITQLFRTFYQNGKKVIPENLNLEPLGLAVWFMDDGSRSRNSLYINSQQFNLGDQIKLQKLLLDRFGIRSTLNKDKIYQRIRIVTEDAKKLCDLIRDFVPKSMKYKLV